MKAHVCWFVIVTLDLAFVRIQWTFCGMSRMSNKSFILCCATGMLAHREWCCRSRLWQSEIKVFSVCVDHLHRCKTSFGCSGFSTLCLQGVAADHLGPLPTKTPIWSGDTDWDANLRTCTNFHFRQWRPAKPSTGMSFGFFHFPLWIMLHLNLLQNFGVNRFHPLYGFRNLNYCWLR